MPRDKNEFLKMCEEYTNVAIGGIVTREFPKSNHPLFEWFIKQAHIRGVKIHGLGYTDTRMLHQYHFDSVDSTAWLSGRRFASIHRFNGRYIEAAKADGKRLIDYKALDTHNLNQWILYQEYARANL